MIKFNDLLNEIGDTKNPYRFRLKTEDLDVVDMGGGRKEISAFYKYTFKTPKHQYEVHIERFVDEDFAEVNFYVDGKAQTVTNEGVMFRVISTVLEIVEDFEMRMRRKSIIPEMFNAFWFSGAAKKGDDGGAEQRERLYKAFIRQQYPTARINSNGPGVRVDL